MFPYPPVQHPVFYPCFEIGASNNKGSQRSSKSNAPRGISAETHINQQRIFFQPLKISDQTATVNVATAVDTMAVFRASISDEVFTNTQLTPQVGARPRCKSRIVQTNSSQSEEAKKPKHEEQHTRYVNTCRSLRNKSDKTARRGSGRALLVV